MINVPQIAPRRPTVCVCVCVCVCVGGCAHMHDIGCVQRLHVVYSS